MVTPILQLVVTGAVLLLLLLLYIVEDVKGRKILLPGVRDRLDKLVWNLKRLLVSLFSYLWNGLVKFFLHHGVRGFLKKALKFVRFVESSLELTLKRQKRKYKKLEGERIRNHLDDIADHKESSALTDKQKHELRSR